ncbi:MAG: cadherin-like domain-containing protein, partial [Arcobacteraceae bacterium]|nr:cadherin-like domain-containing protein [Arcobacteraceae bacterium]
TPLTTIAAEIYKEEKLFNTNYSIDTARQTVATNLGITIVQVQADPLKDKTVFIKTQQIIQTTKILAKTIQSGEVNTARNRSAFSKVISTIAMSIKDDTSSGDLNISKIVIKLEEITFEDNNISIPDDVETFVKNYKDEIAIKVSEVSNVNILDNLQKGIEVYVDEARDKIKNNNTASLSTTFTDMENESATTIIQSVNSTPIISGIPATTIAENSRYIFSPTASDGDKDKLTFSIDNKPTWATFNTATGLLSGTPSYENAGSYTNIIISVTDDIDIVSLSSFYITVSNTNRKPTILSTIFTANENQTYVGTIQSSDADNNTLTYTLTGTDADSLNINSSTGVITFNSAPDYETKSSYTFIVNVSDNTDISNKAITVNITNLNDNSPTISGTPNTIVIENTNYTFTPSVSYIDNNTLIYSISNKPSWATFNTTTGSLTGVPSFNESGDYQNIIISVSDGVFTTDLSSFNIIVSNSNRVPTATFTSFSTNENTVYNGTLTGTDPDGDNLTFIKVDNPSYGTVTINTNGSFTYTPTSEYSGSDSFSYKANDASLDSATNVVNIIINNTLANIQGKVVDAYIK